MPAISVTLQDAIDEGAVVELQLGDYVQGNAGPKGDKGDKGDTGDVTPAALAAQAAAEAAQAGAETAQTAAETAASNAAASAADANGVRMDLANTSDPLKGDALVGVKQSFTGAAARTQHDKNADFVSLSDFGAIGNDSTVSTTAISSAATYGETYTPKGVFRTGTASNALTNSLRGIGQVRTADGNKRGRTFNAISSEPSSFGNENSVETAFNGDWSRVASSVEHRITGIATLGQPATGYLYRPEAMPHYSFLYNESGWNQQTGGNDGRTGVAVHRTKVYQTGQGDAICFNGSVFVTGAKAGATHWLANPAGVLFNGDMTAGQNGVYLNPYETICHDGGFDVACVGVVNNFNRSNATGALSTIWNGYRAQSAGSASCDAMVSGTGKWVTGLDLAMGSLDFGANKAAISLKANDRFYFNNAALASGNLGDDLRTTAFNGDYLAYDSADSRMKLVMGDNLIMSWKNADDINANQSINIATGALKVGGNVILRLRQTGFALPTGTSDTSTFDTATVTTARLAQYVKGLVERLHASTSGAHALISI